MKIFYKELVKKEKTIRWLSDKLGVTHQTVYQWKLGRTKPSLVYLKKIARMFKLNLMVLIKDHY